MPFNPEEYQKMTEIAQKVRDLQQQMDNELNELAEKEYNSIVATGNIKIKMRGNYRVSAVIISPNYLETRTAEQISEGLTMAFNNCREAIEAEKEEIGKKYQEESQRVMRDAMMNRGSIPGNEGDNGNF